jgi:hypothetical protein
MYPGIGEFSAMNQKDWVSRRKKAGNTERDDATERSIITLEDSNDEIEFSSSDDEDDKEGSAQLHCFQVFGKAVSHTYGKDVFIYLFI